MLLGGALSTLVLVVGAMWYYATPKFWRAGYMPAQPYLSEQAQVRILQIAKETQKAPEIAGQTYPGFSHQIHAGKLGMDCRYCHTGVEKSAVAMVPPTQTCMNCHTLVKPTSKKLLAMKERWDRKLPMEWVRVHKLPDYAYFDHSAHLRAGVGCESCHGNVAAMEVVTQSQPLSMSWCLECHRNAGPHLRPQSELTVMGWNAPADQAAFAARVTKELSLRPPTNCSGCHR